MILAAATLAAAFWASVASAADIPVTVGGLSDSGDPILTFNPPFTAANIGDRIIFTFRQKNHTVTQTSFGNVCRPLDGGFALPQFFPVAADETEFPTAEYMVESTDPLWFYCPQTNHCGRGMVFSINCPLDPNDPHSFDAFHDAALDFGAHEAGSASWAATATSEVYGTHTYAPVYAPSVTATVSYGDQVWTTTYESYPGSPDPTPDGRVIDVQVGEDENGTAGLVYSPSNVIASPRDVIVFHFRNKNHTITQSSFGNPCRKLEFTSTTGQVGFDSGFVPVDASLTRDQHPEYRITVNDTAPIYAYCRQGPPSHCGAGMVFTVNALEGGERSFEAFRALAQTINGTGASGNGQTGQTAGSGAVTSANTIAAVATVVLAGVASIFVTAF